MDLHFPTKTIRRKESDLPWLNSTAMKMIRKKGAVFKAEGPSPRWEALREKLDKYLDARKQDFLQTQREKFFGADATAQFFKNVKAFKAAEKPKSFDVRDLCPGLSDQQAADEVAEYFNRISREFEPLQPSEIPFTYPREIPRLTTAQVEDMIKKAKKPRSRVEIDIFPSLLNEAARSISVLLADIFNEITCSYVWPLAWKREYVTIIPKKSLPDSFSDLRNISCTAIFSKIFEGFVHELVNSEISLKWNQYGRVKGCSTTHMLVELIQDICENAEDYRSATVLVSIDYAKAFNRVSYQHCLEAFRKKGASTPVLRLLASFLTNRTMSVRVGQSWSTPLPVNGGCPQGSVLGVKIFNTTTLEDDFLRSERARMRIPMSPPPPDPRPNELPVVRGTGTSTPTRGEGNPEPQFGEVSPVEAGAFQWSPSTSYRPSLHSRNTGQPVLVEPPREEKVGTQVLTEKQVRIVKYVDDNIICIKLNFGSVPIDETGQEKIKMKQAIPAQNAFRCITGNAQAIGMQVNTSKTKVLCISDSLSYTPKTFIEDSEGNRINCVDSMKILGFHFGNKPTMHLQVQHIVKSLRQRYWVLRHLAGLGFNEGELVRVYKSNLRPIADYCAPAYHSLLTDAQDQQLESSQVGALRAIFGYGLSARKLREKAGLETLRERRIQLTDKFARNASVNPRFCHWFPRTEGRRSGRNSETYREFFAKCDRLKNSPLYYMRRRLNGKEGKIYGLRNREYRENSSP